MSKTVLITGASRGIGKECAIQFAEQGYNVIANYFRTNELGDFLNYKNIFPIFADVRKRNDVDNMVNDALSKFGCIDILVNNAGIAQQKLFTDITEDDWTNMFDINVKGIFNCTQAVLSGEKGMINNKSGNIINISSMWGLCGASCEVHYSAAKSAVIGFTKALAKEVCLSGIRVNCIAPGMIDTDMNKSFSERDLEIIKEETPLGRIGTSNEIAKTILFLASSDSSFITGQVISPNGGMVI